MQFDSLHSVHLILEHQVVLEFLLVPRNKRFCSYTIKLTVPGSRYSYILYISLLIPCTHRRSLRSLLPRPAWIAMSSLQKHKTQKPYVDILYIILMPNSIYCHFELVILNKLFPNIWFFVTWTRDSKQPYCLKSTFHDFQGYFSGSAQLYISCNSCFDGDWNSYQGSRNSFRSPWPVCTRVAHWQWDGTSDDLRWAFLLSLILWLLIDQSCILLKRL